MSVEILKLIKDAENEAEAMRKQSMADSRQIVADAKAEAQRLTEQLLSAAESEAAAVISQAEASAVEEIAGLDKAVMSECQNIRNSAEAKMDKAIEAVAGRILSIYGNS